jgi:CubicO group peptidase (beta-lactamase class C family)
MDVRRTCSRCGARLRVNTRPVNPQGSWAGATGVDGAGHHLVPESAMGVDSMTKTFTAAEVMVVADRGLVDLDAPVTDYVELLFDAAGASVRQVLNMSSGFHPVHAQTTP